MLSSLFYAHGQFCANHPWEVLIGTVAATISLMSVGLCSIHSKVCGWNYDCRNEEVLSSSDVIILSVTRCLAIVYIYLQFRSVRKLGSKYLLGLAGLFTIFSSFIFSIAFANFIGFDLDGLNDALPFFLLLVDLSKARTFVRLSLTAIGEDELPKSIGSGMAVIGPALTLDAIVESLAIGVGTLSGVRKLETMCYFGCLSVAANYVAYLTFFPACLSLVLEISRERNHGKPLIQLQQLAKIWQKEDDQKTPNPVTQKVKIIMSAGLIFVHTHSRFIAEDASCSFEGSLETIQDHRIQPEVPLWQFYVARFLSSKLDYGLTIALAVGLIYKYIVLDAKVDEEKQENLEIAQGSDLSFKLTEKHFFHSSKIPANMNNNVNNRRFVNGCVRKRCVSSGNENVQTASFFVGNPHDNSSSSSDEDSKENKHILKETIKVCSVETQTRDTCSTHLSLTQPSSDLVYSPSSSDQEARSLEQCVSILKSDAGPGSLTDDEIIMLVNSRHIPSYKLEGMLGNHMRGVAIRRQMLSQKLPKKDALESLPYNFYDYKYVEGACCENVIGYMPVPVGVAGPLLLDGVEYHVPMATTEGTLVASTNRGCRALSQSDGVRSSITNDGMTRGPVIRFPTALRASEVKKWTDNHDNFDLIKEAFDSTSRFARLKKLHIGQAGRSLYIRFIAVTGDAMGMNMLSKGSEKALNMMSEKFSDLEVISLSGNYCTDKKSAAINWVEGRGKSVVCEAIVKSSVVKSVLKTTVPALVELNISKNLVGSAMAGSIGGFNAHASNIVTAVFIAAGQDPAQNIASSNCIVLMEPSGPMLTDLHISCTMPSIEVGTVGGGTVLPPQASCLEMLGVKGSHSKLPGENARRLAQIVCGTVMAGELSLMSALAAGHLVKSHLKHNRSALNMVASEPGTSPQIPHAATAPAITTNGKS